MLVAFGIAGIQHSKSRLWELHVRLVCMFPGSRLGRTRQDRVSVLAWGVRGILSICDGEVDTRSGNRKNAASLDTATTRSERDD